MVDDGLSFHVNLSYIASLCKASDFIVLEVRLQCKSVQTNGQLKTTILEVGLIHPVWNEERERFCKEAKTKQLTEKKLSDFILYNRDIIEFLKV